MNPTCAHKTTEKFIHELKRIPKWTCMKTVEKDMEELENKCSILKKSSSNDKSCSDTAKTSFSQFKESLKEFLRWVNEKQDCSNIVRNESNFFLDSKCSCPDPWDHRKGLL
ncbi:uncharacterized protein LOC129736629 [Falco cherrug]|uniref:uncharacterized protein LOC129736629 n=1 Tax=Falco cherrug TaxID=345164 RepID=UPI0024795440|nr:uncharacterized protein LOC129736629 [Falco cherrug]